MTKTRNSNLTLGTICNLKLAGSEKGAEGGRRREGSMEEKREGKVNKPVLYISEFEGKLSF